MKESVIDCLGMKEGAVRKANQGSSGISRLDVEFEAVRGAIRRERNIVVGLNWFRFSSDPRQILRVAGRFTNHPAYKNLVLPKPFPTTFSELPKNGFQNFVSLVNEVAWLSGILKPYYKKLKEYVQYKSEIDKKHLIGERSEIEQIVSSAEKAFGISLWIVEERLNSLDQVGVSIERKKYISSLGLTESPAVMRYLINWCAYRCVSNISSIEYDRLLEDHPKDTRGLRELVHILNGSCPEISTKTASEVLCYADALPIIDRYRVFVSTLECLISTCTLSGIELDIIKYVLAEQYREIEDPRIKRMLRVLGEWHGPFVNRDYLSIIDSLYVDARDWDTSADVSVGAVVKRAVHPIEVSLEAVEEHIKSSIMFDDVVTNISQSIRTWKINHQIIQDVSSILSYSDDGIEARLRLLKVCMMFCNASWAASLRLLIENQCNDVRMFIPNRIQRVLSFRAEVETPLLVFTLFDSEKTKSEVERLYEEYGDFQYVKRVVSHYQCRNAGEGSNPKWDVERAAYLVRSSRVAEAIRILDDYVSHSAEGIRKQEARYIGFWARYVNGRVAGLVDSAAKLLVDTRYFSVMLPLDGVVRELLKHHDEPIKGSPTRGSISAAIVYDVYSRLVSSQHDAERADAYKDVLRANGVEKASELGTIRQNFRVSDLVYFLRYVCVPNVLDQSLNIRTTREVEDERVAILLLISELTEGRAPAAIKDELREIRTKQVVREATLRLDQSKIYVNIEGIRRALDVSLRDDWNRYQIMSEDIDNAIYDIFEKLRKRGVDMPGVIVSGNVERFSLFRKMLFLLREEFTLNKEYGLNSNLSTNIRHGYIEREIRGPLLARKLVTNKLTDTGAYNTNAYWLDRLVECSATMKEKANQLFENISKDIDDIIDNLNRRLLRIRMDATPHGLFDYVLDDGYVIEMSRKASIITDYDEFFDLAMDAFWEITQSNLTVVRGVLNSTILYDLLSVLDHLSEKSSLFGLNERLPGLEHEITLCRTELRAAVGRVSHWFTLSSNNEYQDFDLIVAYKAAIKTVVTYFRNIKIHENYASSSDVTMKGRCLPAFARLFFLVLDNAATHCGRDGEELDIDLQVSVSDGVLIVKAINELPDDIDRPTLRRRVDEINRDYGRERAMEMLSEEGGSGYPKIWKLLHTDLQIEHLLHVSVTDKSFIVEILMSTGGIMNETSHC